METLSCIFSLLCSGDANSGCTRTVYGTRWSSDTFFSFLKTGPRLLAAAAACRAVPPRLASHRLARLARLARDRARCAVTGRLKLACSHWPRGTGSRMSALNRSPRSRSRQTPAHTGAFVRPEPATRGHRGGISLKKKREKDCPRKEKVLLLFLSYFYLIVSCCHAFNQSLTPIK